jgi:CRISPR-associated protein Cmr2
MNEYTAVTFAPVQGFIEKSRKLRDLYGASLILSYLSQQLVLYVENTEGLTLISPAIPNLQKGMPNRILIKGDVSKDKVEEILLSGWKDILKVCRTWIENKLPEYQYHWNREWTLWGVHTWEIFQGSGHSIQAAMDDLGAIRC